MKLIDCFLLHFLQYTGFHWFVLVFHWFPLVFYWFPLVFTGFPLVSIGFRFKYLQERMVIWFSFVEKGKVLSISRPNLFLSPFMPNCHKDNAQWENPPTPKRSFPVICDNLGMDRTLPLNIKV